MEANNMKTSQKMSYICECEDFPCCGHSLEERFTTQEGQELEIQKMLQEALDYDY